MAQSMAQRWIQASREHDLLTLEEKKAYEAIRQQRNQEQQPEQPEKCASFDKQLENTERKPHEESLQQPTQDGIVASRRPYFCGPSVPEKRRKEGAGEGPVPARDAGLAPGRVWDPRGEDTDGDVDIRM